MTRNLPSVSLIVACRNEEKYIGKCLDSILAQEYPADRLEILVVDGRSQDATRTVLRDYAARHANIRVIDNPDRTTPRAFNLGIRQSRGDIVGIVSAHAVVAPDYVSQCVRCLRVTGADAVGGPMRASGSGYVSNAIAFVHNCPFGLGGGKFHDGNYEGEADTVYLGAWNRDVFARYGYFDERLIRNQDIEFNARIRNGGGRVFLTPRIRSTYYCRSDLAGLARQNYRNGFWNIRTILINRNSLSLRHFVPLAFVVTLAAGPWISPVLWRCAVLCYLLCIAVFSLRIAVKNGMNYLFILPAVFMLLHVSYGMGSAMGILATVTGSRRTGGIRA